MNFLLKMRFIDLNPKSFPHHTCASLRREVAYEILIITILEKIPILQILSQLDESENMLDDANQLTLFN